MTIRHLHAPESKPVLDETEHDAVPAELEIGTEGTAILKLTYNRPVDAAASVQEHKHYADAYLREIGDEPMSFVIGGVEAGEGATAVLRLGLGRKHSLSVRPGVRFNGQALEVPTDWRGFDQKTRNSFFGIVEIAVPAEALQEDNEVELTFAEPGGHVSSLTMRVFSAADSSPGRSADRRRSPRETPAVRGRGPAWASPTGNTRSSAPHPHGRRPRFGRPSGFPLPERLGGRRWRHGGLPHPAT